MKNPSNKIEKDFHAVDYMRQVRNKLSELYLTDKQKYLDCIRKAMAEFKLRQSQASR